MECYKVYFLPYFYVEYQSELCVILSHLTPFCSSQTRLLTSFPVTSFSYRICKDKPVTCHVMVQRYGQYYMLVTSLFRVFL